jgi:hypothetical protein
MSIPGMLSTRGLIVLPPLSSEATCVDDARP